MRRSEATVGLLVVAALAASCGRLGSGCDSRPEGDEPSVRERFAEMRGEPLREGRWGSVRPAPSGDQALETQIRQLEALGYASGTKTAPGLVGVTRHERGRVEAGLNFYTSGHACEAVLMTMDGDVVHRWAKDFWDVWPEDEAQRSADGTHHWRRAHLFPNGDVIVIFEGLGMAKLDRGSNVIWARRNGAHHDLTVSPNGDIAVLVRRAHIVNRVDSRRPTLEDFVVILDSEGHEKRRHSILEAFERSGDHRRIWEESSRKFGDLFHTNSIEELHGRFVDRNPAFADGNFLLSSRHLNTVFVLDPRKNEVIWAFRGAFKAQHDARLLGDGSLMLFDNSGRRRASSVQVYGPGGALAWEYAGSKEAPFYTRFCGASQRLANGNTLVTESDNGRAFEVTKEGEIVWEFYNPHRAGDQDELIATLFQVDRISTEFAAWAGAE